MGSELPKGEITNAEDSAANDKGAMTVATDPVVADRQGKEESDCQWPHP